VWGVFSREACRVEMGRARERLWAAVFCMVWWAGYGVLLAINMAPDPDYLCFYPVSTKGLEPEIPHERWV
jgi:hypothetical protein